MYILRKYGKRLSCMEFSNIMSFPAMVVTGNLDLLSKLFLSVIKKISWIQENERINYRGLRYLEF